MKMKYVLIIVAAVGLLGTSANAQWVPSGVHNDVLVDTVLNDWGWEIVYQDNYSATASIATVLNGLESGDIVMLAGLRDGYSTFDVLAATSFDELTTYTARSETHAANGAEWYYNGGSMGFAGLGDTIDQNNADVSGLSERDRLSWHTSGLNGYDGLPSAVNAGWRSGDNTSLNDSTDFDKVVLKYTAIPEPASITLIGLVAGGIYFKRRLFIA